MSGMQRRKKREKNAMEIQPFLSSSDHNGKWEITGGLNGQSWSPDKATAGIWLGHLFHSFLPLFLSDKLGLMWDKTGWGQQTFKVKPVKSVVKAVTKTHFYPKYFALSSMCNTRAVYHQNYYRLRCFLTVFLCFIVFKHKQDFKNTSDTK